MKTEVKFRELPEKVQGFLKRVFGDTFSVNCIVTLDWLHNLPEWKDATDDERLAYAEWRYPKQTKFIPVSPNSMNDKESRVTDILGDGVLFNIFDEGVASHKNWIYKDGKWAEIISEPEEKPLFKVGDRPQWTPELIKQLPYGTKLRCPMRWTDTFTWKGQDVFNEPGGLGYSEIHPEAGGAPRIMWFYCPETTDVYAEILSLPDIKEASAQQEFVKANPGMQHVEEPKAGDMVEARIDGWPDGTWRDRKYLCKNSFGKFVCEYKDGSVERFDEIRLPQKSEVESKVKQLMLNYSSHNEIPSANYKHDSVMKMLIEIAKWGQANPDKI